MIKSGLKPVLCFAFLKASMALTILVKVFSLSSLSSKKLIIMTLETFCRLIHSKVSKSLKSCKLFSLIKSFTNSFALLTFEKAKIGKLSTLS